MSTSLVAKGKSDPYLALVQRFPLRPIRSERSLDQAIHMIDELLDRGRLNRDEQDYLEVLGNLVEDFEAKHHAIAPVADGKMLEHLLEARGVKQADVARATGIAESTISEVLAGKRRLNRAHIGKLAAYFQVEPGVFSFEA